MVINYTILGVIQLLSGYVDTEGKEEQGIVEKKPPSTQVIADQAMSDFLKSIVKRKSRAKRKTTTVSPTIYDTELGHEILSLEPRPPAQPYIQEPRSPLLVKRVEDTEHKEEVPMGTLPDVPTPEFSFSKRIPTKPTRRLVVDTEKLEEAVGVEEKLVSPKSVADDVMTGLIGDVKGREVFIDKSQYNVIIKDTLRKEEIVSIEERPNIDLSTEAINLYEGAFTGLTRPMREAAHGFRVESGRREDPYSKFLWSTVGLGLRAGGSAIDAFTMPVRPHLIYKTVGSAAKVVTDAEYRGAVAKSIVSDPLGVGADIVGGFVGGAALGKLTTRAITWKRNRSLESFLEEFPEEDFFVKEELGMQYPETEIVHEKTFVGFLTPEKTKIVDTTSNAKFRGMVDDLIDEGGWKPSQVSFATDDAITHSKISRALLDKAHADRMALMNKGGDALVPSLLLEDGGIVSTVYKSTFRFNTREVHIPGTSIKLPKISSGFIDLSTPLGTVGGLSSILGIDTKSRDKTREIKMAKHQPFQIRKPTPPSFTEIPIEITWTHQGTRTRETYDPLYNPPTTITRQKTKTETVTIPKPKDILIQEEVPIEVMISGLGGLYNEVPLDFNFQIPILETTVKKKKRKGGGIGIEDWRWPIPNIDIGTLTGQSKPKKRKKKAGRKKRRKK